MRFLPVAILMAAVGCSPTATSGPGREPTIEPIPLPDFTLTERGGETVTKSDLKGDVWVASFMFTRCAGPCPRVTRTMARLQRDLAGLEGVRLVTFTVDPDYDTPEVLRRYANQEDIQADPQRWLFLTGDEEAIQRVVTEGFLIHRRPVPDAREGESVDHGTKLVLVDPDGLIRGYYDGFPVPGKEAEFETEMAELQEAVRGLLAEEG